jgi:hypothetical protein
VLLRPDDQQAHIFRKVAQCLLARFVSWVWEWSPPLVRVS